MRPAALALGAAVLLGAVGIGVLVSSGASSAAPGLLRDDAATLSLGAQVYADNCASCHGADLEGEPNWRQRDADGYLPAPPHDETGHTWHHDSETLFNLTKFGIAAMINDPNYRSSMPVYEDVLSDAEIVAVLSYIRSTWPADIRQGYDAREAGK